MLGGGSYPPSSSFQHPGHGEGRAILDVPSDHLDADG